MADFQLTKSETLPLTKELASEFYQMKPSPTERALNPSRVKHLREKADAGLLVSFNWARVRYGGQVIRMNGQHSSTMLSDLNGSFPEGLNVHMDEYEVSTPDGLALLFRQFDDRKSGRSPIDVSGAYQHLHEALRNVPSRSAKLALEGINYYERDVLGNPSIARNDDQYMRFNEIALHGFIQWAGSLLYVKTQEMQRKETLGAIYGCWRANEPVAKLFWEHVARGGVEYEDQNPATVLSQWLVQQKEGSATVKAKAAHFYQAGVYAWNAHRADKPLTSIKVDKLKDWGEPSS